MITPTHRYIAIQLELDCDRENRKRNVLALINKLQLGQKVFSDHYARNDEEMLQLMNRFLRKVVGETLVGIHETDEVFGEFLCHVFFRRKTHIESETSGNNALRINNGEMWQSTKEPLYSLVVAAYVSNAMRLTYPDQEDFESNHDYYEKLALSIFDQMYNKNEEKLEYHVLAYDYESIYKNNLYLDDAGNFLTEKERKAKDKDWLKPSREMLCVAYYGQCMKFISHVACQRYINTRWSSGKASNLKKLFEAGNQQSVQNGNPSGMGSAPMELAPPSKREDKATWLRLKFFVSVISAPQSKYYTHTFFNILFIFFFAAVLLEKPWRIIIGKRAEHNVWLYFFLYIIVCLLLESFEEGHKLWKYGRKWHKSYWWYHSEYIILNCILFVANYLCLGTFLLSMIFAYASPFSNIAYSLSEALFTALFVLKTITTLKYFLFYDYFGAKIQLIKKMGKSIGKYILVLGIFWGTYAVCYLSLTEERTSKETIFWQIFQSGGFEILGEFRDTDRDGTMIECSNISWQSVNLTESDQVRCLFRTSLIPPLLFLYMMTTTIILVNVVTAMLSHKYEEMSENAAKYSKFHKYEILAMFEQRSFFPRPLNLIYICWGACYNLYCCLTCIYDYRNDRYIRLPFFNCQAGLLLQKVNKGRCWGSSPKDVNVNENKVRNLLHKERGTNDFVEAVQEIITEWKHFDQNPDGLGYDKIGEARELVQRIVGKFASFLSTEADGVKREMITAMEQISRSATPANTEKDAKRSRNPSGISGKRASRTALFQ